MDESGHKFALSYMICSMEMKNILLLGMDWEHHLKHPLMYKNRFFKTTIHFS